MGETVTTRFREELLMKMDRAVSRVRVPALLAVALEADSKTGAKALGSIRVASVTVASRIYERRVAYLATLDEDTLRRRREIQGPAGARSWPPVSNP